MFHHMCTRPNTAMQSRLRAPKIRTSFEPKPFFAFQRFVITVFLMTDAYLNGSKYIDERARSHLPMYYSYSYVVFH